MGPDGEERRLVPVVAQTLDREVTSQPLIETKLHAQAEDEVDFELDEFPRQAVLRNAEAEHPARHFASLKDGDVVTHER